MYEYEYDELTLRIHGGVVVAGSYILHRLASCTHAPTDSCSAIIVEEIRFTCVRCAYTLFAENAV